jgi:hypothetical protein
MGERRLNIFKVLLNIIVGRKNGGMLVKREIIGENVCLIAKEMPKVKLLGNSELEYTKLFYYPEFSFRLMINSLI